jgi:N-methylhydantoinase B
MRSLTCARLRSVIFGAFSQAIPERMPAAPAGNNCIVNVMTRDDRTHKTVIAAVNPVVGGGGGMPQRDGTNGSGADAAYLKNTPIEITETEVPVEFVKYGLARDSGGPGRWRGGLATEMAFRVFAPDTRVTVRNRDRSFFRPWGVLGGRAAGLSDMVVNPGTPQARRLGNIDTAVLQPGDVLEIRSAGGGGRGHPFGREPWRVAQDVARGYISEASARNDYGVALRDGAPDEAATAELRRAVPSSSSHFHFGPEREGYEAQWTDAAYDLLTEVLASLPIHWRFFAKTQIFARMTGRQGAEGVAAAYAETRARFPELPAPAVMAEAAE